MRLSERIAKLELARRPEHVTRAELDAHATALLAKLEDLAGAQPAPAIEATPESRRELLCMLKERCP